MRREHLPVPPTEAHVEAYVEERVSQIPEELAELRAQSRRDYLGTPVAEHFPAFDTIMADALDHLWVREYPVPGEGTTGPLWTVFDPDGLVLGFVETPEELEVCEIGEDYILGRAESYLGVESVQTWPLDRTGIW